jgi:hypothetical protein
VSDGVQWSRGKDLKGGQSVRFIRGVPTIGTLMLYNIYMWMGTSVEGG